MPIINFQNTLHRVLSYYINFVFKKHAFSHAKDHEDIIEESWYQLQNVFPSHKEQTVLTVAFIILKAGNSLVFEEEQSVKTGKSPVSQAFKEKPCFLGFFFFFFFFATPTAWVSSGAREQTCATAVTWAMAEITPDP